MPDNFAEEAAVEAAKAVAVEAYRDGLQPAVREAGEIIALPLKLVNAMLTKPKLWVAERQINYEKTVELLAEKLMNVPPEKIVPPENYVAVPALTQIDYCYDSEDLREMYANLLANSMNSDKKWDVHPAYVDIVKQLSPDEAKLLRHISHLRGRIFPVINVRLKKPEGGFVDVYTGYTDIGDAVCDCPQNIPAYLDNLARLKLIDVDMERYILDEKEYDRLKGTEIIKALLAQKLPENASLIFKNGIFYLTEFGKNFVKVCID